jgi:P27 family predicted phage terminase small subunit
MTIGRPPKPTALRVLNGNAGKRPINHREPKLTAKAPAAPVSLQPEARAEWDRVVGLLVAAGIMTEIDRGILAAYCTAWGTAEIALRGLAHMRQNDPVFCGMLIRSAKGNLMSNPLMGILNVALRDVRTYSGELGMTPAARSKIRATEAVADSDNPFLVLKQG